MARPYHVPGPCSVTFNDGDLGVSKNGFIIRPNTGLLPITDDARGVEPGTYLFGGKSCVVEFVGMEIPKIIAADVWDGNTPLELGDSVGSLASERAGTLEITEKDGSSVWTCLAFPIDPQELGMRSTQEMNFPLTFLVIIDDTTGKLFSTVPSYIG